VHDQIGGRSKGSKNRFEIIHPLQVLVGVELVQLITRELAEVGSVKGYSSHKKSSWRGVPYLEFKAG